MKIEAKGNPENHGGHSQGAGDSEALLRAEIGFWRELREESNESMPAASIERMRQALALAELRFLRLSRETAPSGESSDCLRRTCRGNGKYLH